MTTTKQTGILAIKADLEAIEFLTTVTITNKLPDLTEYAQADLPIAFLQTPEADPMLMKSMVYEEESKLQLWVYWIDWTDSATITDTRYEAIIEGLDWTPSSGVVLTFLNDGKYQLLETEYPIRGFRVDLKLRIYAGNVSDI